MSGPGEVRAAGPAGARLSALVFVVVYAVLLLLVPSRLIVKPIGAAGTPATLWGLLALLFWLCMTLAGLNPRGWTPLRVVAGVLAVAVFASYASAMTHGWYAPANIRQATDLVYDLVQPTQGELTSKMITSADRGLLSFGGWMGVTLLTMDGLRSWRDLDVVVRWVVGAASIVAFLGIVQFFTGLDIAGLFKIPGLVANSDFGAVDSRSVLRRVSSTAIHPIEFGVVLAGVFPLALHRSLHSARNIRVWAPTVLIGVAVPMSVSRSAILAIAIVFVILLVGWPPQWRRRALLLAPFVVVGLRVLVPGLVGTIRSLFANLAADPSISGRTDDYGVVFHLYGAHPLLGRGLFTFVPRYYRILDNQVIMWLIELGALGTAVVLVFVAVGYFSARGARRRSIEAGRRHLALALSAGIAGVLFSYVTFDTWGFPMAAGLTFLLIGMAGAAWQVARDGEAEREELRAPPARSAPMTEPDAHQVSTTLRRELREPVR